MTEAPSKPTSDAETALLLIAHGSRRPEANADLVQLADLVRARRSFRTVEIAYLELTEPTIPDGLTRCVESGARRVVMSPYFLSAGTHVIDDLGAFRADFGSRFEGIDFVVAPPLGVHPAMLDILFDRLDEAIG